MSGHLRRLEEVQRRAAVMCFACFEGVWPEGGREGHGEARHTTMSQSSMLCCLVLEGIHRTQLSCLEEPDGEGGKTDSGYHG